MGVLQRARIGGCTHARVPIAAHAGCIGEASRGIALIVPGGFPRVTVRLSRKADYASLIRPTVLVGRHA